MQRHVAPTNRDKSAVAVLFRDGEYDCEHFLRDTGQNSAPNYYSLNMSCNLQYIVVQYS